MTRAETLENSAASNLLPQEWIGGYILKGKKLGSGKDATTYACSIPDLVYRVSHPYVGSDPRFEPYAKDHAKREVAAFNDLPQDVLAARTLMAWVRNNRIHKIIERAPGSPLLPIVQEGEIFLIEEMKKEWEAAIAQTADIPQEHYDRLVEDEAELRSRNIFVDYVGIENLFYCPSKGFTIIDAEFEPQFPAKGRGLYRALIGEGYLSLFMINEQKWQDRISQEARDNVVKILEKLFNAGHIPKNQLLFEMICRQLEFTPRQAEDKVGR